MEAIKKLKTMVNKPFLYNDQEVVIIGYCDCVGDNGEDIEIYLNNGKTVEWTMFDLPVKIDRFRPISNTVVILANQRLNQVSTVNPTVLTELRDTVLDQIRAVKEDPAKVNQAKQIFQGVNAYGQDNTKAIESSGLDGKLVLLRNDVVIKKKQTVIEF